MVALDLETRAQMVVEYIPWTECIPLPSTLRPRQPSHTDLTKYNRAVENVAHTLVNSPGLALAKERPLRGHRTVNLCYRTQGLRNSPFRDP